MFVALLSEHWPSSQESWVGFPVRAGFFFSFFFLFTLYLIESCIHVLLSQDVLIEIDEVTKHFESCLHVVQAMYTC